MHPLSRFRNIWDTITLGEPTSLGFSSCHGGAQQVY